jgi:hypothetical protein
MQRDVKAVEPKKVVTERRKRWDIIFFKNLPGFFIPVIQGISIFL